MLASILPGFRELRAPLAGGYLWLLWFWLVLGDVVRIHDDVSGPAKRLAELGVLVSDVGHAVAASVAAYVVGSILLDVQAVVTRRVGPTVERVGTRRRRSRLPNELKFSTAGTLAIMTFARRWLAARSDRQFTEQEVVVGTQHKIGQDRDVLKTRLLDLSPSLHSEVDRPDAEATFRAALWPPMTALAIYLVLSLSPWWGIAFVWPLLLAWQGRGLRRKANDALATAFTARPELADVYGDQLPYRLPDALRGEPQPPPNLEAQA